MNDEEPPYDMTMVAPDRREETSRRIGVIERYIAGEYRNATVPAAELGLSYSQFSLLVQVWRRERRPEELSGAKGTRARVTNANPRALHLLEGVEGRHPDRTIETLVRIAQAEAEDVGLPMPSVATLRKRLAAARLRRTSADPAGTGLAIDHCAIQMGVRIAGTTAMPIGSFLVDLDRRRVLGVALTDGPLGPDSAARAVVHALDALGDRPPSTAYEGITGISLRADPPLDWAPLGSALAAAGLATRPFEPRRTLPGLALTRILGPVIADFRLRVRMTTRAPEDRRMDTVPIGLDEAERTLRKRLADPDPTGSRLAELSQHRRDRLASSLRSLATDDH